MLKMNGINEEDCQEQHTNFQHTTSENNTQIAKKKLSKAAFT
jgi:hypothetical protein